MDSDAFQSGRCVEHNGCLETPGRSEPLHLKQSFRWSFKNETLHEPYCHKEASRGCPQNSAVDTEKAASYGYRARAFDLSYTAANTARSVAKV